jgi:hypothetical protein
MESFHTRGDSDPVSQAQLMLLSMAWFARLP